MDITESEKVFNQMREVLSAMQQGKPNDRSEADRRWAIAITDYEKAIAAFWWFVVRHDVQARDAEDFEHFLSYSGFGLTETPETIEKLRQAFEAAA